MGKKSTIDRQSQAATPERFPFRPHKPLENIVHRAILIACLVLGLLISTILILSIIVPSSGASKIGVLLAAIFTICMTSVAFSQGVTTLSDVGLEEGGVRLQLFGPWSTLVPWQALREMTIEEVGDFLIYEPVWLRRKAGVIFAVHVPGLTVLHLITGLYYGMGFCPIFLITPAHERYELLIERLKQAAIREGCESQRLE
jgi:hypothetical protein